MQIFVNQKSITCCVSPHEVVPYYTGREETITKSNFGSDADGSSNNGTGEGWAAVSWGLYTQKHLLSNKGEENVCTFAAN